MADAGESDSSLGVSGAELSLEWEELVEISNTAMDPAISPEALSECEEKLAASVEKVIEGYLIPATSTLGSYLLRLAQINIREAFSTIDGDTSAQGLDSHLVRWGPYQSPPFSIKFPSYGQRLEFSSWEDVRAWAERERQTWEKLVPLAEEEPAYGRKVLDVHIKHFNRLIEDAQALVSDPSNDGHIRSVWERFGLIREGRAQVLTGVRGRQLYKLFAENPPAALIQVALRNGAQVQVKVQNEDVDFAPFLRAISSENEQNNDLDRYMDSAGSFLTEFTGEWKKRESASLARADEIRDELEDKKDQFAQLSGQLLKTHRGEINDAKADMAQLRKTYEETIQLKAPAKYWADKRLNHIIASGLAFIVFCLIGYFSGTFLWEHKADILAVVSIQASNSESEGAQAAMSAGLQLSSIVLVTIPALLLFWVLRLVSRVFVTNLAGISDAGHRATLISTFLALVNSEDAEIVPEERLLLIQGIMSAPGKSGDDAAPSAMLENLAKSLAGGRPGA